MLLFIKTQLVWFLRGLMIVSMVSAAIPYMLHSYIRFGSAASTALFADIWKLGGLVLAIAIPLQAWEQFTKAWKTARLYSTTFAAAYEAIELHQLFACDYGNMRPGDFQTWLTVKRVERDRHRGKLRLKAVGE